MLNKQYFLFLLLWVLTFFYCIFVLKDRRTLGLLVENWGRVNYGKTLDEQRKGTNNFKICVHLTSWQKQINHKTSSTHLSGIIGDIELNSHVLRDFIIHSLDMKPGFINRFVSFNHFLYVWFFFITPACLQFKLAD